MRTFEKQSLNQQLMDLIISCIEADELTPGKKLPPEAELANQFNVSRNTLRETLKTLETFGVIESLHGQGTFVSEYAKQRIPNIGILKMLSANHSVHSLMDARLVIEPSLAKLAAERRTEQDIERLQNSTQIILGECAPNNIDKMFHMVIASVAKCDILYSYLQAIYLQLMNSPYAIMQEKVSDNFTQKEIQDHKDITECIASCDGEGAKNLMEMHLRKRFNIIKSIWKEEGIEAE